MPRLSRLASAASLSLVLAACGGPPEPSPGGDGDADGDLISDLQEGFDPATQTGIDTDGDGRPDYLDGDSDDDTLLDRLEAGDDDLATAPVDSDGDGIPDWRDLDSDDNGIEDGREATGDLDGDGLEDFRDPDDDNDRVADRIEIAGRTDFPPDHDGDLSPDYRDPDADNDLILDGDDGTFDSDQDGDDNRHDDDSDGDGIADRVEAGDESLATAPVDTDGDGAPDFLDLDSDADSLPDALELAAGTDFRTADSDGDGVDDLIEAAAGTDGADPLDNPRARGDFVFVMPFREPPEPRRDTLDFRTNVQFADVYFAIDNSSSMQPVIEGVRGAAVSVLDELTCEDFGQLCAGDGECGDGRVCSADGRCIADPKETGCIASLWTGTGTFSSSCGQHHRYVNEAGLQPDPLVTRDALPTALLGGTEDHFRTLACIADPTHCDDNSECAATGVGCPGFREDALRLVIMLSDEPNNCLDDFNTPCDDINDSRAAGALLESREIFFVGVNAAEEGTDEYDGVRRQFQDVGRDSDSLDGMGRPIVLDAPTDDPSSAGPTIATAIREVSQNVPLFVNAEPVDAEDDDGDALLFIDHIEINFSGEDPCTFIDNTFDLNTDGYPDTFPALLPGTSVCWDVVPRENQRVPPAEEPQVFRARIVVQGDNTVLDARTVWFLVPPEVDVVPIR